MNVVLIGDSIFDNAPYVNQGEEIFSILTEMIAPDRVTLLATDGDITSDVKMQMEKYPDDATHVFVSCGGNDALQSSIALEKSAASVGDALEIMHIVKERFRLDYVDMLNRITERYSKPVICTIYNNVPLLPNDALTALALFNEVILEEAFNRRLSVIDLRIVCNEAGDYSEVSPIEPSYSGGIKIAKVIKRAIDTIGFNANESVVFS